METNDREKITPDVKNIIQLRGTTIPTMLIRALMIKPDITITVIYQGEIECPLMLIEGRLYIEPQRGRRIFLEGALLHNIGIQEKEVLKARQIIDEEHLKQENILKQI